MAGKSLQSSGKTVDITGGVGATTGSGNGREPHEGGSLLASFAKEGGSSDITPVAITGEGAVGSSSSGMDSSLRNLVSSQQAGT